VQLGIVMAKEEHSMDLQGHSGVELSKAMARRGSAGSRADMQGRS
jgi:hypothetical protein